MNIVTTAAPCPTASDVPDFSIVIPVYFNEENLAGTMKSLWEEVLTKWPELRAELVFVDDGSGDNSLGELLRLQQAYPRLIRIIRFTRNFGQASALLAGMRFARGRFVVTMSADGQDPPHLINDMLHGHRVENFDIVICMREGRDESLDRVIASKIFYWMIRKLSFPNMPPGGFDFVSMSRRVVDVFLANTEAHYFFQGQILWTGFPTKFIPYTRRRRSAGKSRYTLGKKLTNLIDAALSFSYVPLRLMSLLGIVVAFIGFLYAVDIFFWRLFFEPPVQGWAPLMIVILIMGGIQMLMLGVLGEYLWRTLAQVRQRAPYVIERIYEVPCPEPGIKI